MNKQNKETKLANVYIKLSKARVELQKREIKESGYNSFSKYKYSELKDFMPHINEIQDELGLISIIEVKHDETGNPVYVTLTIVNTEDYDDKIDFKIPFRGNNLKGPGGGMQDLGAAITYARRYLYTIAYEISVPDDLNTGAMDPNNPSNRGRQSNNYNNNYNNNFNRQQPQQTKRVEVAKKEVKKVLEKDRDIVADESMIKRVQELYTEEQIDEMLNRQDIKNIDNMPKVMAEELIKFKEDVMKEEGKQ